MNLKKIVGVACAVFLIIGAVSGQQLKIRKNGAEVRVLQGKKLLYRVVVKGKPNRRGRKYDGAFLAGPCLLVRRDIREVDTGTETSPDVARLEVYRPNGQRRVYYESNLEIGWIDDWSLINSPDFSWAIIPYNGEGMFDGYFHISTDCRITHVLFGSTDRFDWGDLSDASFIDPATLKFASIVNRPEGEKVKKSDIFITKDGKFRVEDAAKQ